MNMFICIGTADVWYTANPLCLACFSFTGIVVEELHIANATIYDIMKPIKDICNNLIGAPARECVYYASNIPKIISWIDAGCTTTKICRILKMCK